MFKIKGQPRKIHGFHKNISLFLSEPEGRGLWVVIHRRHQNGQVRKDERMGLAKTPPGDGERTHLRFAFLSQAKYHFKMSEIVFFRIRRLRLEDGGQFHNNILIKEHEFLKKNILRLVE